MLLAEVCAETPLGVGCSTADDDRCGESNCVLAVLASPMTSVGKFSGVGLLGKHVYRYA